ncbi:MAG: nucleotidyltransferase family protein [Oscillospiraceae bacterium]
MTEQEYLIGLLRGLLYGQQAKELPEGCGFERVFGLAQKHSVAGMAYYAVETLKAPPAGELAKQWRQVRDMALVKDITQLAELESISAAFSAGGVRFLPLKGCIIKHLYPQSDMRTMSDIDMLIDPENAEKARDIMAGLGYSCEHFGYDVHDVYHKPPVMSVEVHRELFGEEGQEFQCVFPDPWSLCGIKDGLRYDFGADAFFAYVLAHAVKHLEEGGTGIRTVMDLWVCVHSGVGIDCGRALDILEPSGKSGAARRLVELSEVWFGDGRHTEQTRELERYIFGSGTYGTVENSAANRIRKSGRGGYLVRLVFPTFAHMKQHYPVLKRAPVLLPVCWLARLVTKPFVNRRQNAEKMKMIMRK